jgi:putative spermidine/putrescine transport system substrate-binding protein
MAAAVSLLAGCSSGGGGGEGGGEGGGDGAGETLILATYQGPISDAMGPAYLDDFTADTGINVTQVPADRARYVASLEDGNPEWNSFESDEYDLIPWAAEGHLAPLDASLPRADMISPEASEYAYIGYSQALVMAYRESSFPNGAPQNWADFFDTEKFPGKRGFPGFYVATAEAALMADGVPADPAEMYPLDFDRAFAKMDSIKSDTTVFESYSALAQGLQAGSVDVIMIFAGRAVALSKEDPDVVVNWNQNVFSFSATGITAEAPNAELMQKLAEYTLDPERQAEFATLSGYGPIMSEAYDFIAPEDAANLPGTPEHMETALVVDAVYMSDPAVVAEYNDRYVTWTAQ